MHTFFFSFLSLSRSFSRFGVHHTTKSVAIDHVALKLVPSCRVKSKSEQMMMRIQQGRTTDHSTPAPHTSTDKQQQIEMESVMPSMLKLFVRLHTLRCTPLFIAHTNITPVTRTSYKPESSLGCQPYPP